jgi:hypothetical protein
MTNCRDCVYFERKDRGDGKISDFGYCHRYPSVFMGSVIQETKLGTPVRSDNWGHPFMTGGDKCGEFQLGATLTLAEKN